MSHEGRNFARKTRLSPLVIIFIYNILFMAASGLLVPGTPLYLSTNGFEGSVNLILSSIAISSLMGQVMWGCLLDRAMNRLFFLELGTTGYALGYLLIVLLRDGPILIALLILTSFIGSASYPAAMVLLAETSSVRNRGRSMGAFWSAASLGWAISVAFSGFVINLGGSYFFGLCSLLYFASLILVHLGLRSKDNVLDAKKIGSITFSLALIPSLGKTFLIFLSGSVIFFMADFTKNVYVPMFYAFELGLGMITATLLLSLTSWLEIPINILFGSISDKIGRKAIVLLAYALCGIYMLVNSMVGGFEGALLAMSLYGFVWGAFSGPAQRWPQNLSMRTKGASQLVCSTPRGT